MLKKQFVKSRGVAKVTFEVPVSELPEGLEIESIHLVGDFNNWDPTANELEYVKRGVYKTVLELEPGVEYQYRYYLNGEIWFNDWHADGYVRNAKGTDNCVVYAPAA